MHRLFRAAALGCLLAALVEYTAAAAGGVAARRALKVDGFHAAVVISIDIKTDGGANDAVAVDGVVCNVTQSFPTALIFDQYAEGVRVRRGRHVPQAPPFGAAPAAGGDRGGPDGDDAEACDASTTRGARVPAELVIVPSPGAETLLAHPQYLELPTHKLPDAAFDVVYTGIRPGTDALRHDVHARYQSPTGAPVRVCLPQATVFCGAAGTAVTEASCWEVPTGDPSQARVVEGVTTAAVWTVAVVLSVVIARS